MSNFFHGKMFAKISELDETVEFDTSDEFVVVKDQITQKISGLDLTESIVTIGNLASKVYVNAVVSAVVDGAPVLLDTLNELAAALNDDANFATTITALIGTKLPTANFGLEFSSALATKTTTVLAEGTNLYYTEQRVLDVINSLPPDPADRLINGSFEVVLQSSGTVVLPAEPTSAGHAATKGYVDSQLSSFESFSGSYNDLTDKPTAPIYTSVTTTDLNVQNVTFTGSGPVSFTSGNDLNFVATGTIAFNSTVSIGTDGKLTLLAAPTSNNHAATKLYVDTLVNTIVAGGGYATTGYVAQEIAAASLDGGAF